jgi:hypothetical protein
MRRGTPAHDHRQFDRIAMIRRHLPLLLVLGVAIGVRAWFTAAYQYAFFFPDTMLYVRDALSMVPNDIRPAGYSFLIKPLAGGPYRMIAVFQHVIGVALIVAGYAFLLRRGAKPLLAALAMVPLAVDARQLTLEHYILAETAYVALTVAGFIVLAWRDRLGTPAAAAGGALLAFAALTRSVGLPILALAGVYLLVRRVGWRQLAAFALPVVALLGGYQVFYERHHGVYAFTQNQGRFLYARVMPVADCSRLELTAKQRTLCDPNPPANFEHRPDRYIWSDHSPAYRLYRDVGNDEFLNEFATTVIKQRPGAYLAMVAEEASWHFWFRPPLVKDSACLARTWLPPERPGYQCQPFYYVPVSEIGKHPAVGPLPSTAATERVHAYGQVVTTPGPLYAAGVLLVLAAALRRPRGRSWRPAADAVLFVAAGVGLMLVSVATSMYEQRYAVPAVALIPMGMVLAWIRLTSTKEATEPAEATVPVEATAPAQATVPAQATAPAEATEPAAEPEPAAGRGPTG